MNNGLLSAVAVLSILLSGRGLAAPGGVVSAATPEATAAGVEVLEAGGNAVDAAIAVQFALAVTEPAMSGLGGGTQVILQVPGQTPVVINGTTFAPRGVPRDATKRQLQQGRTAATIPSTVRVMEFLHRRYGSGQMEWPSLLTAAVRYAEEGWVVGPFRARVYRRHEQDLRRDPVAARLFLTEGQYAPREGELVRMPVLAQTLRRLQAHGGMDFYTGAVAADIATDMAANGGWITAQDLAGMSEPRVVPALTTTYRGYNVYSLPPPAGGWVMLQALNLLEQAPIEELSQSDETRMLHLLRALRLAHGARAAEPIGNLADYEAAVATRLSKQYAAERWRRPGGETTHFSIVDQDGMAVAVTTSIDSYFGGRAPSPKLGFFYNNYMQAFEVGKSDHPFALRPGAMPLSSMSAAIVTRDGEPVLVVGSPGSARIISAVSQVISYFTDVSPNVMSAVAAPRVHALPDGQAYIESTKLSSAFLQALGLAGFSLTQPEQDLVSGQRNAYFGGVHAVGREALGWRGAADPRRDGTVGYAQRLQDKLVPDRIEALQGPG
ncbi:MAG TPA: gamma-glutamyltransferase [Steroidobacteraceae bacterium]|nr:gamma-glutamyltransferase [Steroidobacteraceae bacterium]